MDYLIGSDGELYHAWLGKGAKADEHKYIKREWKNGRWQYTYPSAVKGKTSSKKSTTSVKPRIDDTFRMGRRNVYIDAREGGKSGNSLADAVTSYKTNKEKSAKMREAADTLQRMYDNGEFKGEDKWKAFQDIKRANRYANGMSDKAKNDAGKINKLATKQGDSPDYHVSEAAKSAVEIGKAAAEKFVDAGKKVKRENRIPLDERSIAYEASSESKASKKETNFLESFGDWASDKLSDIGDGLEDLIEDAGDWVEDAIDTVYDATIGEVKDRLGYGKRALVESTKYKMEECREELRDSMDDLEIDLLHANGSYDDDFKDDFEASRDVRLKYACEDYLQADADYNAALELYAATPLGKIDSWINGKDSTASDESNAYTIRKHMDYDPVIIKREAEFLSERLAVLAVNDYIQNRGGKANADLINYRDELSARETNALRELQRWSEYDDQLYDILSDRNIEMERIERVVLEFEKWWRDYEK